MSDDLLDRLDIDMYAMNQGCIYWVDLEPPEVIEEINRKLEVKIAYRQRLYEHYSSLCLWKTPTKVLLGWVRLCNDDVPRINVVGIVGSREITMIPDQEIEMTVPWSNPIICEDVYSLIADLKLVEYKKSSSLPSQSSK